MSPGAARRALAVVVFVLACAASASAQDVRSGGVPGPSAATGVPSPAEVLGYDAGERFTEAAEVYRYVRVLSEASDRVALRGYGRTPEGRALVQVVISSPENLAALEPVLARNRELTEPATDPERARQIAGTNPAVIYFSYGVHGDEASSSEAAMWTAWDLARGAPEVAGVLDSVIVVIDPVLNPDGRDRYVHWYRQVRAEEPNPDPASWEHRQPWPGGRYNHYLFDLNRDWAWMTQPETRSRLATWDTWNPQVHVDFHEMSRTSTYFFFPPTDPINPIYPDHVLDWGVRFGAANARAFDERGWLYFTGSTYDLFYPGYGDSWPSLLGSVGMTYEQAGGGSAGLVVERPDGTRLTLDERVQHHRTAGHTTLVAAARSRSALLEGFAETYRNVDDGLSDVLLVPGETPGPVEALVALLRDQGIRVERTATEFRAEASAHPGFPERERFPAGTYRVPVRQSRGRLASALLRPDNPVTTNVSYDITAWSLPYAHGVEAHSVKGPPDVRWAPVGPEGSAEKGGRIVESAGEGSGEGTVPSSPPARVGFLVPPDFGAARSLMAFLRRGGRAVMLPDTFSLSGRRHPAGSIFLARSRNDDLDALMEDSGLASWAVPVTSGRVDTGADLGTGSGRILRLPTVALLGGRGTDPSSFGSYLYLLERTLAAPFDVVRVEDVDETDLAPYDVVVAPSSGGLVEVLGPGGLDALDDWVRKGGTLVAVDEAARAVAETLAGVKVRTHLDDGPPLDPAGLLDAALATRLEREEERRRDSVQGVVLPVRLDPTHPLGFGAGAGRSDDRMFVLSSGNVFEPSTDFESPAFFPGDVELVSGTASSDRLQLLSRGSWLVEKEIGEGRVVLFADDPIFRHFWYVGFQLFTNALLLAGSR